MNDRNDIRLIDPGTGEPGHFRLREFENNDGLAMVSPGVLWGLERVREELNTGDEVWIIVTDAVRTDADLERLVVRLGWVDEGGAVSRDSKHLAKYGGIAVDIVATWRDSRTRFPVLDVAHACRHYFDWVKLYSDGHVHADNRDGCKAMAKGTGRVG